MRSLTLVLVLVGSSASAHLALTDPPSRDGASVLKTGPCGSANSTRTDHVTTYRTGDTITVHFDEYVDHPGHFRIALDLDGDDDFADPPCVAHCADRTDPAPPEFDFAAVPAGMLVLADDIADTDGGTSAITVTLPDVACDNCTLQVIQVMYDKRPITVGGNDVYYQCADLVITRDGDPVSEPTVEADANGAETSATAETTTPASTDGDDGCGAAPGAGLIGLLALRNRRRD